MIFRQLFDRETCTYTYLLADEETHEAVLIDSVREHYERDRGLLLELGLTLKYTLETHVHADHITASGLFRMRLGSRSAISARGGARCADIPLSDGDTLTFGRQTIEARATPGHTSGCMTFVHHGERMAFTGDTLFIRGCGRTDFQEGDSATLYQSVHGKIFSLPDDTRIFPGHDYKGRTCSTVAEETRFNPRLGGGNSEAVFIEIMGNLTIEVTDDVQAAIDAKKPLTGMYVGGMGSEDNNFHRDAIVEVPLLLLPKPLDPIHQLAREPLEPQRVVEGHVQGHSDPVEGVDHRAFA